MKKLLLILVGCVLPASAQAATAAYKLDPDQSHVRFADKMCEADLLMGDFRGVKGTIWFDEEHPDKSRVEVTIDARSGVYSKEMHKGEAIKTIIEGKNFLDVEKYPVIIFKSTKVEQTSDFTADVNGDLTLMGITHPFTMEVTFDKDQGKTANDRQLAAFSAYGKFKRSDFRNYYGLDRLGIRKIGDEVTVLIVATGVRPSH
ncbi:MAG TPA: YceI family protein [Patescibacteria group bacterium]|jgi:polyisoprenoid-binding protein YceI|nr:YceI family protein [Patescibacteria group bacterium]